MGNIASAASAACIVGAAAVIIAKPVCDFVKHRLEAVEADVKKAIKLIEETNESLDQVKQTIVDGKSDNSDTVLRAIDNIMKTNKTLPNRMEEVVLRTVDSFVKTNEALPNMMSKMEDMMSKTIDGVTKTNEAVDALPETIDATAKKYSMYLHDEHVNMFELMSGLCPSPAISPRSYASEGAAQGLKRDFFKSFNPAAGSGKGPAAGLGKGPATGLGKGPAAGLGKGSAAGLNPSRKSKNGPLPQASLKGKENF